MKNLAYLYFVLSTDFKNQILFKVYIFFYDYYLDN